MSWTCPKCERELPWKDYRHYCARVSVDSLFEGRSAELVLAFDKILAEVADWDKVLISTTPNCIVFYRRTAFLIIRPMKKWLEVKYYVKDASGKKEERKSRLLGQMNFRMSFLIKSVHLICSRESKRSKRYLMII